MHEVHVWRDALHQLSSQKISEDLGTVRFSTVAVMISEFSP